MIAVALAVALAAAPAAAGPFTVETLAPGVDLYRGDPLRGYANSLVVARRDGLAVVDAQPSPAAAKELLAAIAARSGERVRFLILSHPHVESVGGAAAFPEGVLRIGSRGCAEALANSTFDFGAEARARSAAPADYRPPPALGPVLVLEGPTTLDDPANLIQMFPLPPADTEGSLLVVLPNDEIYFVGDILAWQGNPFAEHASIEGWIARLNAIATLGPKIVVPSRGPADETAALRRLRDRFLWIRSQVSKSFVDLVPAAEIPDRILSNAEFPKWFDSAVEPSFARGVIDAVLREAQKSRRLRGLP